MMMWFSGVKVNMGEMIWRGGVRTAQPGADGVKFIYADFGLAFSESTRMPPAGLCALRPVLSFHGKDIVDNPLPSMP